MMSSAEFDALLALSRCTGTPVGDKWLVVAYKEVSANDGFVLTAYFADRPSGTRRVLWSR